MSGRKTHKEQGSAEKRYLRENALRPNRFLGHDHNNLGVFLMGRDAYAIAERSLRRAVWLNPYEPEFGVNLAWCLYKQERLDEARECLAPLMSTCSKLPHAKRLAAILDLPAIPPNDTLASRSEDEEIS